MNIINPNLGSLETIIRPIYDSIIQSLSKIAFKCNKSTERYNLRYELYTSKYIPKNLESKELELEECLEYLKELNVKDKNVKSYYDSKTEILKNSNMDDRGYFEVEFFSTIKGRKALLENFYSVSTI